jgi:hypothetical protein
MIQSIVGVHFDCGCELIETGNYVTGRPQRPPLQLNTLYLMYFTAFGAFCLSTFDDKTACDAFYGPILAQHAITAIIADNLQLQGDNDQKTRDFCFQRVSSC